MRELDSFASEASYLYKLKIKIHFFKQNNFKDFCPLCKVADYILLVQ